MRSSRNWSGFSPAEPALSPWGEGCAAGDKTGPAPGCDAAMQRFGQALMHTISRLKRLTGPRFGVFPAAVLVCFCQACRVSAAPSGPLRPDHLHYTVEKQGDWSATEKALEKKYAEPEIALKWERGWTAREMPAGLFEGRFDSSKVKWQGLSDRQIDRAGHRVMLGWSQSSCGFIALRCRFNPGTYRGLRAFFSTNHLAVMYLNGSEIYRGLSNGKSRPGEQSIDLNLPDGPSELVLIVEVRRGTSDVYLRVGKTNSYRRRIAILKALQELCPQEYDRVLFAQSLIAGTFERDLRDPDRAEVEWQRLWKLAEGDAGKRHEALEGLARVADMRGDFERALDVRGRMVALARKDGLGSLQRDLVALASSAGRLGRLTTAYEAAVEAFEHAPGSTDSFNALLDVLAGYSLKSRADRLLAKVEKREAGENFGKLLPRAKERVMSLKANAALLGFNYNAGSRIQNAGEAVRRGGFETAANELVGALDSSEGLVIAAPGGGVGLSWKIKALLSEDENLTEAFRRLADDRPLGRGASRVEVLLRRPLCRTARHTLDAIAVEAAASGRYSLSALAAERALSDFPGDAEAAALAVSSLVAAGRVDEAADIFGKLSAQVRQSNIARGITLAQYASRFLASRAKPAASLPKSPVSFDRLDIVWQAPLAVSGLHNDAGTWVRRYGPGPPKVRGVLYRGRFYCWDGKRISARDLHTGRVVFDRVLEMPPGVSRVERSARPGWAPFMPPAAVTAGSGGVYVTVTAFDEVLAKRITLVAAADAESGETLWITGAGGLVEGLSFVSAPVWACDRVYILARRSGQVPRAYLVCLDACEGSAQFVTLLAAGYGTLSARNYRGAPNLDPVTFVAAPRVSQGMVFAVPNAGVIAAVDCLTGGIRSIQTYPRSVVSSPDSGLTALLEGRSARSPAVASLLAAVAPKDSAEAFIMRPGRRAVTIELPGAYEVIGISGETAVCAGDAVFGADVSTGKVLWRCGHTIRHPMPGGLVRDGLAYVPEENGLLIVNAGDGEVVAEPAWPDGVPRGNLVLEGDYLVALGPRDVTVCRFTGSDDRVEARFIAPSFSGGSTGRSKLRPCVTYSACGEPHPAQQCATGGFSTGDTDLSRARKCLAPTSDVCATVGKPRYGCYFPPAGFAGMWAAPKAAGAFVVETGGGTEPLLFAQDERRMVFQPGFDCACWDVTTSPRLMWRVSLSFAATGAVFAGGRIVVFNDWRLSALDSRSGDVLWTYRTARRAPVEFAMTAPVRSVVASARRVAFVRDKRVTVLDAATGEAVYRHSFESVSPVDLAAADGVFVILTSSRSTGTRLAILSAQVPEGASRLKALVEVSPQYAQYARMTTSGGRVYILSPGKRFVTSVDVAAGRKRWRNNRLPNISRVLKVETAGGSLISTGAASDRNLLVSIFAEADGKLLASYRCRSFGAAPGGTAYIVDTKMRFCRYRIGKNKPVFQKKLDFGPSWLMPLDWRFVGGNIYMLLGNPGSNISKGLSLARIDAATGRMEGPWGLPVVQADAWSAHFEDIGAGRVAIVAGRGVLVGTWEALCGDRMVPLCRAGHPAGAVPIGKAAAAQASAVRLGAVVADGDLADWAGAEWVDVGPPGGQAKARTAFAYDGKRFFVGIQTFARRGGGSRTGSSRRDFLRLSVDAAAASIPGVPKVDFDMFFVPVPGRGVVTIAPVPAGDVAVEARPNRLGGCDCEIAIPWAVLGRKGPDSGGKAVMAAALGGVGGSAAAWSWPRGVPYKPGFFGKIRLEGEAH